MINTLTSMMSGIGLSASYNEAKQSLPRLLRWSSRVNNIVVARRAPTKPSPTSEMGVGYPWTFDAADYTTNACVIDANINMLPRHDALQVSPVPAYALSPDASELPLPELSSPPTTGFYLDHSQIPPQYANAVLEDCLDTVSFYPNLLDFGEHVDFPIMRNAMCEVVSPKPFKAFKVQTLHDVAVKELKKMAAKGVDEEAAGEADARGHIGWDDASDTATNVEDIDSPDQESLSSTDSTLTVEPGSETLDSKTQNLIRVGEDEDGELANGIDSFVNITKVPEDGDFILYMLSQRLPSDSSSSSLSPESSYHKLIPVDIQSALLTEENDESSTRRHEAIHHWRSTIEI
ncbi:hypothetical protein OF83DRAFT_1123234 [Amylostereum chailletii]|nr:hypothetical protein OF83DRAFT_1123234 [Amylostereum chailletii]